MEFEQMQSLWNDGPENAFSINKDGLSSLIHSKKMNADRIANYSELLTIVVNALSGVIILLLALTAERIKISLLVLSVWMLLTFIYVVFNRIRRKSGQNLFTRSLQDELAFAISTLTYQVHLSFLMRLNIIPVSLCILAGFIESQASFWVGLIFAIFTLVAFFASSREHLFYETKRNELQLLELKLKTEKEN